MIETSGPLVSKGEFAQLSNVSAGRVSQWISEGKIHGAAIVGEGQRAKIDVGLARRQLQGRLDLGQRLGNGIDTRLDDDEPVAASSSSAAEPPRNSLEQQFKAERLRGLQMQNRAAAEAELARRGMFTATADVQAALAKTAGDMIATFEGALPDFASAIAAHFQAPQRDVLHLLRTEFRKTRVKAAQATRAAAERLPGLLAADLAADPAEGLAEA